MIELKEEGIRVLHDDGFFCCDEVIIANKNPEKLKEHLLQNEKLRKIIVDLADLWDGLESSKYGQRLDHVLNDLGIKDIPEFYSKENMDKFIKELDESRKRKKK